MIKTKVLVPALTVISKTTQTLIGEVIDCADYDFITLHIEYNKGDETGLSVQFHTQRTAALDLAQDQTWSTAAGVKTCTLNSHTLTDAVPHYLTFDVRGIEFCKFTQGGTSNDGTPTGTFEASYTLK